MYLDTLLGTGHNAANKIDRNPCHHEAYILLVTWGAHERREAGRECQGSWRWSPEVISAEMIEPRVQEEQKGAKGM